jgi:hypothetical protein
MMAISNIDRVHGFKTCTDFFDSRFIIDFPESVSYTIIGSHIDQR